MSANNSYDHIILTIIWILIAPIISFGSISEDIKSCRENALCKNGPYPRVLQTYFNEDKRSIDIDFFTEKLNDVSGEEKIVTLLNLGDAELNKISPDEQTAYSHYLLAYDLSHEISNTVLRCESLKKMLDYKVYRQFYLKDVETLIQEHRSIAYDSLELYYNKYYQLRSDHEYAFGAGKRTRIDADRWNEVIKYCNKHNYHYLLTKLYATQATYLSLHENALDDAKMAYENAITASQKIGGYFYEKRMFASHMNMGRHVHNEGMLADALQHYKIGIQFSHSQINEQGLILANSWIADCYNQLDQQDSAYHYLNESTQVREEYNVRAQETAVREIQQKYQNEKLSNELSQESLKRKQFYLTSLSLGGLLFISLLGLWGVRYISRLKQINLQQQVKESEQRGQLAAVNAQLDGEEQERKRVATVLHDGISSQLTAATFLLQLSAQKKNGNEENVQKAHQLVTDASERTRQLSHDLYPPVLIKHGLLIAIESLLQSITSESLQFEINIQKDLHPIPRSFDTKLYYTLSEVLQNVIKHSQASLCTLQFYNRIDQLYIEIIDNGIGMKNDNNVPGHGIQSISPRITSIGGKLDISANIPQGTKVIISIPLTKSAITSDGSKKVPITSGHQ